MNRGIIMLRKVRQIGVILCALMLAAGLFVFTGCKKGPSLKGADFVIGNWWTNYDVNTFQPQNENEEKLLEWRTKIQKDNGFTMSEKNIASWGEMSQLAAISIMAGSPEATVFVLEPAWAMSLVSQNLAYPVSDSKGFNFRNPQPVERGALAPEWNQNTINSYTMGGKVYAFSNGVNMSNADVVFFNKRLFREAGLDPNLPYDMQKAGTWTWDAYLDICKKLTRDINNDGIMDTYALTRDFSVAILSAVISSNGAMYVDRDASGKFVNATTRPEFLEALQFAIRLNRDGVMKPNPEGARWDWFKSEFIDGNVAMRIEDSYVWGELRNMKDDWGVVMFPRGPRSSTYRVFTRENVLVVPATFNETEVEQILYALNLWYTPVTDDWKSGWYNTFRDSRAVDETLAIIRDTSRHINKNHVLIPGLNTGDIAYGMWYHEGDPAQLIERVSSNWNNRIADVNDNLSF
jgi:ABC-type glycerol-3-phosphate transport system substrate-binding protein